MHKAPASFDTKSAAQTSQRKEGELITTRGNKTLCSICCIQILKYSPRYFLGEKFNPAFDSCNLEDIKCDHSPQCVLCQPFPSPSPSVTFLVNYRSKYHKHTLTTSRVPGQYGSQGLVRY